jgi:vacuolar-type H+-ATPase subunit H
MWSKQQGSRKGFYMDNNYLLRIIEAERQHDEIVGEAEDTAAEISEKSRKELKEYEETLQSEIENMERAIIEESVSKASEEIERLRTEHQAEYETIRATAAGKMDEAVQYIIERIVGEHWQ